MGVKIEGLKRLEKRLSTLQKQIPYTMALTLNDIAFDSMRSLNGDLKGKLKTRVNTSKAFAVEKATKTRLTASVHMKHDWHYLSLQHHYRGGKTAFQIGFEREMIRRGHMTNSNSAIPRKKWGKKKYSSTLKALNTRGGNLFVVSVMNRSKKTRHLHPGIYMRLKTKVKPILLFTEEANYKKRLDMEEIVGKVVRRRAEKYFAKNLKKAMRTAR
jgi:hypothetical protein